MSHYKEICPAEHCTGCMACANACAHSAITIEQNDLGFSYPRIAADRCTDCGLCRKVCPELNRRTLLFPRSCHAAAIKGGAELESCASGGAATALALTVLNEGGAVCGCSGEDMHRVRHIIIEKPEDVSRLKGSKYVQSEIAPDLYKQLRTMLLQGRQVLFIGTGCQTAGLQNFLQRPYDNLLTVDLVCHGVPSQKMLDQNIALYPGIDPSSVRFRTKTTKPDGSHAIRYGWSAQQTNHTGVFRPWAKDPYMAAFLECTSFRDCCYSCRYAYAARQSDITVADFWGLGRDSRLSGANGVSLLLANTPKGEKAIASLADIMDMEQRSVGEAICGNGQLQRPSRRPQCTGRFRQLFTSQGIRKASRQTAMREIKRRRLLDLWSLPLRALLKIIKNLPI